MSTWQEDADYIKEQVEILYSGSSWDQEVKDAHMNMQIIAADNYDEQSGTFSGTVQNAEIALVQNEHSLGNNYGGSLAKAYELQWDNRGQNPSRPRPTRPY